MKPSEWISEHWSKVSGRPKVESVIAFLDHAHGEATPAAIESSLQRWKGTLPGEMASTDGAFRAGARSVGHGAPPGAKGEPVAGYEENREAAWLESLRAPNIDPVAPQVEPGQAERFPTCDHQVDVGQICKICKQKRFAMRILREGTGEPDAITRLRSDFERFRDESHREEGRLQRQLSASQAEVERLNRELAGCKTELGSRWQSLQRMQAAFDETQNRFDAFKANVEAVLWATACEHNQDEMLEEIAKNSVAASRLSASQERVKALEQGGKTQSYALTDALGIRDNPGRSLAAEDWDYLLERVTIIRSENARLAKELADTRSALVHVGRIVRRTLACGQLEKLEDARRHLLDEESNPPPQPIPAGEGGAK